jgi:hypothetical protein
MASTDSCRLYGAVLRYGACSDSSFIKVFMNGSHDTPLV